MHRFINFIRKLIWFAVGFGSVIVCVFIALLGAEVLTYAVKDGSDPLYFYQQAGLMIVFLVIPAGLSFFAFRRAISNKPYERAIEKDYELQAELKKKYGENDAT